ncbi:helix-turn-helix transcriptional regulator [Nocardioides anomalus]|uniref:Helix-turn-helix transcriptional regulator n=2 Tax=Nocardioides anomalus TaxID=2712223 RepID=A0A6G6WLN1_9ACTN|nr:helix-turn-helix transcriptional regulator [Nocardioides anomalus]
MHDPQILRAIAHPVRNRILAELDARGSLRAADVARELDLPANQASFHLRQLAKYGLIEEDPDAARDKRDRVWRTVNPEGFSVEMSEVEQQPGGKAASRVFRRTKRDWGHLVVDAVLSDEPRKGRWSSLTDTAVLLTRAEAQQLSEEIEEVLSRWGNRAVPDDQEERMTYLYWAAILPYPAVDEG